MSMFFSKAYPGRDIGVVSESIPIQLRELKLMKMAELFANKFKQRENNKPYFSLQGTENIGSYVFCAMEIEVPFKDVPALLTLGAGLNFKNPENIKERLADINQGLQTAEDHFGNASFTKNQMYEIFFGTKFIDITETQRLLVKDSVFGTDVSPFEAEGFEQAADRKSYIALAVTIVQAVPFVAPRDVNEFLEDPSDHHIYTVVFYKDLALQKWAHGALYTLKNCSFEVTNKRNPDFGRDKQYTYFLRVDHFAENYKFVGDVAKKDGPYFMLPEIASFLPFQMYHLASLGPDRTELILKELGQQVLGAVMDDIAGYNYFAFGDGFQENLKITLKLLERYEVKAEFLAEQQNTKKIAKVVSRVPVSARITADQAIAFQKSKFFKNLDVPEAMLATITYIVGTKRSAEVPLKKIEEEVKAEVPLKKIEEEVKAVAVVEEEELCTINTFQSAMPDDSDEVEVLENSLETEIINTVMADLPPEPKNFVKFENAAAETAFMRRHQEWVALRDRLHEKALAEVERIMEEDREAEEQLVKEAIKKEKHAQKKRDKKKKKEQEEELLASRASLAAANNTQVMKEAAKKRLQRSADKA